jgi:hypothetical protein
MASAKRKVAGSTFWIGTTASDGSTDTYVQIKGAKQVGGDLGGSYQAVDTTDIDDTVKQESKTLLDPGQSDLEMHEVVSDAGQAALKSAFDDTADVPYNFQIIYPNGDKRRGKGKVMTWQPMVGGANAVRMIRSRISFTELAAYVP